MPLRDGVRVRDGVFVRVCEAVVERVVLCVFVPLLVADWERVVDGLPVLVDVDVGDTPGVVVWLRLWLLVGDDVTEAVRASEGVADPDEDHEGVELADPVALGEAEAVDAALGVDVPLRVAVMLAVLSCDGVEERLDVSELVPESVLL